MYDEGLVCLRVMYIWGLYMRVNTYEGSCIWGIIYKGLIYMGDNI